MLKNFGIRKDNGEYEVYMMDLSESIVEPRNPVSVMREKNIYNIPSGDETLEKKLDKKIEDPMFKIVKRLSKNIGEIVLTRRELDVVKKYILIQIFRSLQNMRTYEVLPEEVKLLMGKDPKEGENGLDFWKRELETIVGNDWDSLLEIENMESVRFNARVVANGFLTFFSTKDEFVINDSGAIYERLMGEIPKDKNERRTYINTGIWLPLSSNLAIACVDRIFRGYFIDPGFTEKYPDLTYSALFGFLNPPEQTYVNRAAINEYFEKAKRKHAEEITELSTEEKFYFINSLRDEAVLEYKDDNDLYIYTVHRLGPVLTTYWNVWVMNEVDRYLCFKTPAKLIPAIEEYNQMKADGKRMNNDYADYANRLKALNKG